MNIRNIKLHQCITTPNPDIIESYIKFDNYNSFDPILLNCDLDKEKNNLKRSITSPVTYITHYKDANKKIILSFGLVKDVVVNDIIRKPTLKKYRSNIYFSEYFLVSKQLNTKISLK